MIMLCLQIQSDIRCNARTWVMLFGLCSLAALMSLQLQDKASGNGAGFGFVTFRTAEAASTALRHLNGADVDGCNLRVNYAFQGGAAREDTSHHYHIFVGEH